MASAAGAAEEELQGGVEAAGAAELVVGALWMGTSSFGEDWDVEMVWQLRNWGRNDSSAPPRGKPYPCFSRSSERV